ncbi:Crp/Fnr family transcriptional regulator [Sulfurihydrogenibium subterraneum]|uniref:Crp/Fnr family transcriptional regulator n=1 Tax=Sulfurihydrogenibium subterraneum TaxID=171121 RepID=UPI00048C5C83|nr:Crp/Fnr family transcriptional regulator [Sulfurihydrogenibium subterraneum]
MEIINEFLDKAKTIGNIKIFEKNEVIFRENDNSINVYILLEGLVSLHKLRFDGKEIVVNYLLPISFVGEYCNFLNIPYNVSARFETKGKVLVIEDSQFRKVFMNDVKNLINIIKIMSNEIKYVYSYTEEKSLKNAKIKIARFLIGHGDIYSKLNKSKLASILGLTPETLSRTLKEFKDRGIIKNKTFIDRKLLYEFIKEELEEIDINQ